MTSVHILVHGARLELARWGAENQGLPILLLHEGLGSVSLWKDFPERLAAASGRQVIAWSRRGHGGSDLHAEARRPDYMHREAGHLAEVHSRLGIDRAHWFGHSDGASIALIGAARHPELAAGLVLEAPHVFVEELTITSIAEIGADYARSNIAERMKRHHSDPDHTFAAWNKIWLDPAFLDWNIEELLPAIKVPTLLIQGLDDQYGTLAQLDRIEAGLPGAMRLELAGCGHSPHRDHENTVIEAVCRFLDGKD